MNGGILTLIFNGGYSKGEHKMNISNVNSALTAYQYAGKTQKTSANEIASTEKTTEMSEAEEMALFKKEFYADLDKLRVDKSLSNVAINISEAGFKAMKDDPEYREKILLLLKRDLGSSVPRQCSAVFTVGATLSEYRGDSWGVGYDSEFYARSQNSFYKKTNGQKDRQKELLEEYQEKRVQAKKLQERNAEQRAIEERRQRERLEEEYLENLNFNRSLLNKTRISNETMEEMSSVINYYAATFGTVDNDT